MKDEPVELRDECFQRLPYICLIEEKRIREARLDYLFITVTNNVRVLPDAVRYSNEIRHKPSTGGDREVALMLSHYCSEHLYRKRKVRWIKVAADCNRVLNQIRYLGKELRSF